MKGRETVWVVDDDRSIRWVLEKALQRAGMEVATFAGGSGVLERLGEGLPDVRARTRPLAFDPVQGWLDAVFERHLKQGVNRAELVVHLG